MQLPRLRLDETGLPAYLRGLGVLPEGGPVSVEPAGDGNINWVRRVRSGDRSFVVKQARPALERFPEYRVSTERIVFEARYYETVAPLDEARVCPEVLRFDEGERVLVLEDVGRARDAGGAERMDAALARGADVLDAARVVARFLGAVHAATAGSALADRFRNDEMRRLHGDHIFALPLRENDFPLSPALRERAAALWRDRGLRDLADTAYARYLEPRGALVHADVQATNVLLSARGPRLLDAEIAHVGDPAFDAGTWIAHLLLPGIAAGRAGAVPAVAAWTAYAEAGGAASPEDFARAARYAGLELLRRTIGAARVPAVERDEAGLAVLAAAERWIRRPPERPEALAGG